MSDFMIFSLVLLVAAIGFLYWTTTDSCKRWIKNL